MSSYEVNPVIDGLREYYNDSPAAREILDHFSSWKENRKVTSVKRVLRSLEREGSLVRRPEIVHFFQKLHSIGLGEFVSGEGMGRPRFLWGYSFLGLSQLASGEAWELEPLLDPAPTNGHDVEEVFEGTSGESSTIKHDFRLRENLSVRLKLPSDLTANEASRLADFIKTLPFGS